MRKIYNNNNTNNNNNNNNDNNNNNNNNNKGLIPPSSQLIWITMWLQLYNYKIYIKLIIDGLGYNGLYNKITN